jgi:hypothetical protein
MKSYRIRFLVKVDTALEADSIDEAVRKGEDRLRLMGLLPDQILETLVIPTGERSITIRGGQRP